MCAHRQPIGWDVEESRRERGQGKEVEVREREVAVRWRDGGGVDGEEAAVEVTTAAEAMVLVAATTPDGGGGDLYRVND